MSTRLSLQCPQGHPVADPSPGLLACPCGSPLDPVPGGPARDTPPGLGIFRHRSVLGVLEREISLGEGDTPVVEAVLDDRPVACKLEFLSPTGSYKDRGVAYQVSALASAGAGAVAEDSSGNAGAAYAAYAAAAGLRCEVFVPEGTPAGKTEAIRRYGATLHEVAGDREATHQAARAHPAYAGHSWMAPYLLGLQTFAHEVLEHGGGNPPAEILFPVGQGGFLYATYLAFDRLLREGRIDRLPALTGVQAEACAPYHRAAELDADILPEIVARPTLADAIRTARPVRWRQVLAAVKATGGEWAVVAEREIEPAREDLARRGLDVEPTSALPWAVLLRRSRTREGFRGPTLLPLTGSGWKARSPRTP